MAKLDTMLKAMVSVDASDLHMAVGEQPKFRVHGDIGPLDHPPITLKMMQDYLFEILTPPQKKRFDDTHELDFAYGLGDMARYRVNYFMEKYGPAAAFRLIPARVRTLEEILAPPVIKSFAQLRGGLVLVTGPTGSGKSTTLAAAIDYVNENYYKHILTIEDPIEFVHQNKKCLISQREVFTDTESFGNALRSSMREDPDVILVGEMRDLETISLAITSAEMGQLVFATLHTNSAVKTVDRIIDVFPHEQQAQIRTMLSTSLKGVVAQTLLRTADGKGRIAAWEVLVSSDAVGNIIREGRIEKIKSVIESGRSQGMETMDSCILRFLREKKISAREAYEKAQEKGLFASAFEFEAA
jgi:twitching motility protein PilT